MALATRAGAYLVQTIPHFLLNVPKKVLSGDEELGTREACFAQGGAYT